ncbi:hypothetical protein PCC7424_1303 [Gloeothece citriformis PCC 7424]|uniref:Uncharacterized protein n=2 Tax=Gloeothece TaxID=28070 RepID=B7K7I2_GLOC7|nr:hypothetical protein PCC7424_1303 [Gloeothece citriformis PCC 7424]
MNTDSDSKGEILSTDEASYSDQEVTRMNPESLTETLTPVESPSEEENKETVRIELPEPDAENITVLSHKLPNKPILPWNHYDSPWEDSETQPEEEEKDLSSSLESSHLDPPETSLNPHDTDLEIDEVE